MSRQRRYHSATYDGGRHEESPIERMKREAQERMAMRTTRYACGECDFAYKTRKDAERCHPFIGGVYVVSIDACGDCDNCGVLLALNGRERNNDLLCAGCWLHIKHGV